MNRVSVTFSLMVLLLAAGCGKKDLDKSVDRLVNAAASNDYATFKQMSNPSLVDNFPPDKFKRLSQALGRLGTYKDRSMRGIEAKSGGIRTGRYELEFDGGNVDLELTLKNGKLVAFNFSGDALEGALRTVTREAYSTFKVASFHFVDDASKKLKNNIYRLGEMIRFSVVVHGLTRAEGTLWMRADLRVTDGQGQVVLDRKGFLDKKLPAKADDPPVGTLWGRFTAARAGTYKLQLQIHDSHAKRQLDYRQVFSVEPQ